MITAIVTSVFTTLLVQLTFGPRLQARTARIMKIHTDREEFRRRVIRIISAGAWVSNMETPPGAADDVRDALKGERARWIARLDEDTQFLMDNLDAFSLGYATIAGVRQTAIDFAFSARMTWISIRPVEKKAQILLELAGYVNDIFFARWSHRRKHVQADMKSIRELMEELNENRR